MFGIAAARRCLKEGSRRLDRNIEGHLLRRSKKLLSDRVPTATTTTTTTRNHYSLHRGANLNTDRIGIQRIVEVAAGSFNTCEDREWRKDSQRRSLHWEPKTAFDRNVDHARWSSHGLLTKSRMTTSTTLLDAPRRPLEWKPSLTSTPFTAWTTFQDPQNLLSLGAGSRGSLINYSSATGSKRYLSTESSGGPNSQYKTSAKIPTPKEPPNNSIFNFSSFDPQALLKSLLGTTWSITKIVLTFLVKVPMNTLFYLTHPQERREKIQEIKGHAKKEFDHYWTGTKLLMADVRTARDLIKRTLSGSALSRRERKQLLRTVSDLFRLVPFSMFLIIPAAEFALPFALRLFPNMLPSTYQDSLKAEETMKRELQSRIAMAHFFQETLEELAKEQKRIAAKRNVESPNNEIANMQEQSAASMLEFLDRSRKGEMMPPDVIIQYAKYFQDDLTLDNMPRMQLVNMCRYMKLQPYGADSFLRFQLRHRIRLLKEDDQRIIWEGIDSLTKMELREACQERGMRSTGLSKEAYKRSLQQWLDLSVHKNVPISLLIMSRIFFLQEEISQPAPGDEAAKNVASLADAISGMDKEVLNEVILEVATQEERKSNPDIRKIKLEVVTQQNERIREERQAAEKKKKASEKVEPPPAEELVATVELELSPEQAEKLAHVVGAQQKDTQNLIIKTDDLSSATEPSKKKVAESAAVDEEKEHDLSPAEMDAISQLLSADPVSKEREDLARIKSAIAEKEEAKGRPDFGDMKSSDDKMSGAEKVEAAFNSATAESPVTRDDKQAAASIEKMLKTAAEEADKSTVFSTETKMSPPTSVEKEQMKDEEEAHVEDPVVARLKKKLESMVDKIELQLSDVEGKIGDKLHFLDKDADGVLSREEMAEALLLVLKRKITFQEAMEIADSIDENKDGVFTVQELIKWIETSKLVQLESEGRDADMDRIMEKVTSSDATKDDVTKANDAASDSKGTKPEPDNATK